jgi:chromosome segregation protein
VEADIGARRAALEADARALEALAAEVYALESQVQLDAQNMKHWQEDVFATTQRVEAAARELADVIERKAQAERERAEGLAELERMGVASREDEVTLQVREEELRRTVELLGDVTRRLEAERKELVDVAARQANHESRLAALQQRRAELEQWQARLGGELEVLTAEEAQLESARREVLERVEQHRQTTAELLQRRGEEEASLERLREAFSENEVMVLALREELSDKRSRLSSLEELQRNYEGFDRGVRAVMLKAGSEPRALGVFGLVSDVVTAPPEFEKAIEAALGERLQHVIVETPERAWELVEYLKGVAEGRSTFLCVPRAPVEPLPPLDSPDVLTMALAQVQVADEVLRPLVTQLLSGVALVADADAAKRLSATHPAYTFVTRDGEVVRPQGAITGGALEGPAVGALQKKREIAELQQEVARVEERYNELITRHYELQKQLGHVEGVLKGLEKHRHAEELSLAAHEKDLHQAGSSLVKLRERIAGLAAERDQVAGSLAALDSELESARGELLHGQADRALREDRVRLLGGELESLKSRYEGLTAEVTALKVKVASVSERGEAVRQRVDALSQSVDELTARAGRLAMARDEGLAHAQTLQARIAETEVERGARQEQLGAMRGELDARRAAQGEAQGKVREEEARLKDLRTKLDELTQGLSSVTLKERELTLELEHLTDSVEERHGVSMVDAVHQYHHVAPLTADARDRLKELRAQVERMGEVNVTAIEEHHELQERHAFLSKQQADLESSLAQLKEAIAKIDETSRVRFKETFDIVNEKFQQVFPRLFGGGRASLMLVQGAPGEEPGVEILAQPPGKKLQSVSLFSGGEKALTAVAMIFAIFLIKPTPFCVLDEVDAPLDEGNVGRYNELVREMSRGSQFILITHNKRTMEVADTLYGVTMEEPGVSKLVTVKLHQAAANSDQQVA